jgi:hypothetical protein
MSQVHLLAAANGLVAIKCRETTLTFLPTVLEKLAPHLEQMAAASRTGEFQQYSLSHYRLFSGSNTVALADTFTRRVIFLATSGACKLLEHIPRFCALARLLAEIQSHESVIVAPASPYIN